ncbi:hypothetical protein T492DRAFT_1043512 [Pavlovales sp. CCMP2436]|nr:hypothetical protein T492DRAFT_1043512 [Pavlovales sp. CCMP2436]
MSRLYSDGVVGELYVTAEDVKKTVGFGRYWPRQAHGLSTGAWTYDGLWMPSHAPPPARSYPWGDKGKSNLIFGFDKSTWTTTQADILKPLSAEEAEYTRTHRTTYDAQPLDAGTTVKGAAKLDASPYNALTGLRKETLSASQRLEVPGKRLMFSRSISDVLSEDLDGRWLGAKADPRTLLRTPVSEVRDHFSAKADPHQRFLNGVEMLKSTGSIGPPGW